ncbi:MAG: NADH:ubiquinone reductase (Na(+)-transporting) subunit B [Bacteroidales bacterium]|nr:NADH:ubiquinone reductase (Na(+)-transporting) subunit B [Bacteroidales bacterium]
MDLRKYLDKIKPNFEEGGKHPGLKSTFEAFESFLFVPNNVTASKGAHIRDSVDLKRTITVVIIALIPALLFGMWNVGYFHHKMTGETAGLWGNFFYGLGQVLPILVVSYVSGLFLEFLFAQIRKEQVNEGFLATGLLIPMIVPVDTPLWMVAIATMFAVLIGKEVFGGTGMNIVNPALLARAFLFFAYPSKMSGDKVWIAGLDGAEKTVDGFSGATPLGELAQNTSWDALTSHYSVSDMFFGFIPGAVGETSTLCILLGAILLIWTGVASWKIMLSGVLGVLFMGLLLNFAGDHIVSSLDPQKDAAKIAEYSYLFVPAYAHLILGGFAFGIVFMATDPVTAAQTETGKWIYGFLVGVVAILVRVVNPAFPEGVMMAILLMNVTAPIIDHIVVRQNVKRRLNRAKASK